jgi:hypothetical protein
MCSFKIVDIRIRNIYIYKESAAEHHSQISSLSLAALQINMQAPSP